jgi:hypothetical protein
MIEWNDLISDLTERKALSVATRRKMGLRMKKLAKSSAFKAKVARNKKKLASDGKIKQRANKQAKQIIIKKFAGLEPNDYANLSLMQRQNLDNRIMKTKGAAVKKIAKRLMVTLRKAELIRLKNARGSGTEE